MKKGMLEFLIISSIVGSNFGVGIVSGQEMLQIFVETPFAILPKVIIYVVLLMILAFTILDYSAITNPETFADIIVKKNKTLRFVVQLFFVALSFVGLMLMFAGAGSVLNSVTGIDTIYGSIILATFICIVGLSGSQSILKLFNVIVPILIIICLFTSIYGIANPNIMIAKQSIEKMSFDNLSYILPFLYAYYCGSLLITVLVPVAKKVKQRAIIARGIILTGVIYILAISAITFVLIKFQGTIDYQDMPMLEVASYINPILGSIYLIALLGGVILSPSAIIFGMINFFESYENKYLSNRKIIVPILCVVALFLSTVGFSKIIAYAVPIVGTISFIIALTILVNYIKKRIELRKELSN